MGALLALCGIAVCLIVTPVSAFREYRRQLRTPTEELALAQVHSKIADVVRSGATARKHRLALRAAIARRLLPGWTLSALLMIADVFLA